MAMLQPGREAVCWMLKRWRSWARGRGRSVIRSEAVACPMRDDGGGDLKDGGWCADLRCSSPTHRVHLVQQF
eukprot:5686136-Prymnesium_polylepis.2